RERELSGEAELLEVVPARAAVGRRVERLDGHTRHGRERRLARRLALEGGLPGGQPGPERGGLPLLSPEALTHPRRYRTGPRAAIPNAADAVPARVGLVVRAVRARRSSAARRWARRGLRRPGSAPQHPRAFPPPRRGRRPTTRGFPRHPATATPASPASDAP